MVSNTTVFWLHIVDGHRRFNCYDTPNDQVLKYYYNISLACWLAIAISVFFDKILKKNSSLRVSVLHLDIADHSHNRRIVLSKITFFFIDHIHSQWPNGTSHSFICIDRTEKDRFAEMILYIVNLIKNLQIYKI